MRAISFSFCLLTLLIPSFFFFLGLAPRKSSPPFIITVYFLIGWCGGLVPVPIIPWFTALYYVYLQRKRFAPRVPYRFYLFFIYFLFLGRRNWKASGWPLSLLTLVFSMTNRVQFPSLVNTKRKKKAVSLRKQTATVRFLIYILSSYFIEAVFLLLHRPYYSLSSMFIWIYIIDGLLCVHIKLYGDARGGAGTSSGSL